MGYENSVKAARRCSRRWWYLNPKNAERLEEKRSHERKRKRVQTKSRAARQKCIAEALDSVIFDIDEDPFESALAVIEETAPVEESQNVIVHLSQLKTPIDSPNETDLYTDEALSAALCPPFATRSSSQHNYVPPSRIPCVGVFLIPPSQTSSINRVLRFFLSTETRMKP